MTTPQPLFITAFYHFVDIDESTLPALQKELLAYGHQRNMEGLVLVAPEGVNGTIAAHTAADLQEWKQYLTAKFGEIVFKDSGAEGIAFRRWAVKIKKEIVGLGKPSIRPKGKHRHLTPAEWDAVLKQEDVLVLDTRNSYEYGIGKFEGAIDCGTTTFSQFPAFVEKAELPKDKKILMYCTGGIRCEKALLEMEEQGYDNVYQLDGGILAYLQQFPESKFEGECFVFDYRVAVDQKIQPSKTYGTCPHCGDPGDLLITCVCGIQKKVCATCAKEEVRKTCSKRCRNDLLRKLTVSRS